jgi:sulfite dehydrogenase
MKKILILCGMAAFSGLNAEVVNITLPQETAVFKTGNGAQAANGQCLTCHSVDYISSQPPKGMDFWQAEVTKMQAKYGAPIPANQTNELVKYLASTYGTGVPAPAPAPSESSNPNAPVDAQALAQRSGCLTCHNVSVKIVGPAYKDVAAKYNGRADALERVSHQISHGGSGQWGQVMMPPFPQFSPEEVKALGEWVLAQK